MIKNFMVNVTYHQPFCRLTNLLLSKALLLKIATLLACGVSLAISVVFWSNMTDQENYQRLYMLLGIVFEFAKLLSLSSCCELWQK
jgi:hypothetical protein